MMTTLEIDFPQTLLVKGGGTLAVSERSLFLLALKYYELGELTSGQAAEMSKMGRVAFLVKASALGVPVVELDEEELKAEFA